LAELLEKAPQAVFTQFETDIRDIQIHKTKFKS
jgi:hypothetical protein